MNTKIKQVTKQEEQKHVFYLTQIYDKMCNSKTKPTTTIKEQTSHRLLHLKILTIKNCDMKYFKRILICIELIV